MRVGGRTLAWLRMVVVVDSSPSGSLHFRIGDNKCNARLSNDNSLKHAEDSKGRRLMGAGLAGV
jgi:hypothetical protein